jgi:hypothetical protein
VQSRLVCSLSNDDARRALVQGADGGLSVRAADGRSYWFFGDTLFLPESGKQIEPNAVAVSPGLDGAGCPSLAYHVRDGVAVPFIPKDGSLTVWPSGAWPRDDGAIDVFTVYVYGSGPYAYWIGEVGVARLDPATMQLRTLSRRLFDGASGHPSPVRAAQPVERDADGRLRVVLETHAGTKLLARVDADRLRDAPAYEYWDGSGWTGSPGRAAPLWPVSRPDDPLARLASFENSAHVAWNAYLGRYVAVANSDFATISARTAERLEGPWSDPVPWVDCLAIAEAAVPVCYSPLQHMDLSGDGSTVLLTLTRMATYDTVAVEITLDGGQLAPAAAQGGTPP